MNEETVYAAVGGVLQYGLLGIVCLALCRIVWTLWQTNQELYAARIADKEKAQQSLTDLVEQVAIALTSSVARDSAQADLIKEVKTSLERVNDNQRSSNELMRTVTLRLDDLFKEK